MSIQNRKYDVRNNDSLRASFNELTRNTFEFDFTDWYARGHWQEKYIPNVIVDGDKVVSNISVNLMQFEIDGESRHFIQLGTVMTDKQYRGQGLNRQLMEQILEEYRDKTDGIYLFANDDVLEYYPKFGFQSALEYVYGKKVRKQVQSYEMEKVDLSDEVACGKLYAAINSGSKNDGFPMQDNLGLYQFWLAAGYKENVYCVPEINAYVIAAVKQDALLIYQIWCQTELDVDRLAASFGSEIQEVNLGFTPIRKEDYERKVRKVEDSTLFVTGECLEEILKNKIMFPLLSHA